MDMHKRLEGAGATVIGPVGSVEDALAIIDVTPDLDAAVLDIRLQDDDVFPVADRLTQRNVPFVFATGYGRDILPPQYTHVPWCTKPFDMRVLATTISHAKG